MRVTAFTIAFALVACGNTEEDASGAGEVAAAPTAAATTPAVQILSRLGGFIVPARDFHVELLPKSDGKVEAVVLDAQGQVVAASAGMTLGVKLTGPDNQQHDVQMTWDAARSRWVGQVQAEGEVAITTGPAEVSVSVGGEAHTGTAASVTVAAAPTHGGAVVLAGGYSVELVPVEGAVTAYVVDASGVQVAADPDVNLKLDVGVEGSAQQVELAWDGAAGCYKADVAGGVDLQVAPVGVVFASGGVEHRGRIVHVRHAIAGNVAVAGGAAVDIDAPSVAAGGADVRVRAPSGSVSVMAGSGVRVAPPSAMVTVSAMAPSPPSGSAMASAGVSIGGGGVAVGGVSVMAPPPPPTPMVSTMASAMGGVSIGGGGGIRIGN